MELKTDVMLSNGVSMFDVYGDVGKVTTKADAGVLSWHDPIGNCTWTLRLPQRENEVLEVTPTDRFVGVSVTVHDGECNYTIIQVSSVAELPSYYMVAPFSFVWKKKQ